jgi:hypothetical protein
METMASIVKGTIPINRKLMSSFVFMLELLKDFKKNLQVSLTKGALIFCIELSIEEKNITIATSYSLWR